jgi:hypothetical protein
MSGYRLAYTVEARHAIGHMWGASSGSVVGSLRDLLSLADALGDSELREDIDAAAATILRDGLESFTVRYVDTPTLVVGIDLEVVDSGA